MITNDKIEEYLIHTSLPYEQVHEGMWLIHDENEHIENIVVLHTPPVITFRVKLIDLADIPAESHPALFAHLLTLNATQMVAGAYGLEDDAVVVTDSLQSENLDYNEFQASLDSIAISIREHYDQISRLVRPQADEDLTGKALEDSIVGSN